MTMIRRLLQLLTSLLVLSLLLAGTGVLWLDSQLSAAAVVPAEVVLAGSRVTDLDAHLPGHGADTSTALQVLTDGPPAGIGSSVGIQVVASPTVLARLATDGRWPLVGWSLLGAGIVLAVLVVLSLVLGRRRRRRTRAAAVPAAALALLMLAGCSWTGDDVDRDAYRDARAQVASAFRVSDVTDPAVPEPVGGPVVPVADPESAALAVLSAAGLPADPAALNTARFLTRQLFDPAVLCRADSADDAVFTSVTGLLVPGLAEQLAGRWNAVAATLPGCTATPTGAMLLRAAGGSVADQLPEGYGPGTTVSLTVSAGYQVTLPDGRSMPWTIIRQASLGFLPDQPDAAVYVSLPASSGGPGSPPADRSTEAGPAWDTEELPGVTGPSAEAAADVVQALARLLGEPAVALGQATHAVDVDGLITDEVATGVLQPADGTSLVTSAGGVVTEVRVLEQQRQFTDVPSAPVAEGTDAGKTWRLYPTGETPGWQEGSYTRNPYAVLDWLHHLSAAAPVACPTDLDTAEDPELVPDRCALVVVPTSAALTPGTAGWREAMVHARRGNPEMHLLVGLRGDRLVAVRTDRTSADLTGDTRVTSTWTFGASTDTLVPVPRPSSYVVSDRDS